MAERVALFAFLPYEGAAWAAYLCGLHGHIIKGVGTGVTTMVYSGYCARCGARVNG